MEVKKRKNESVGSLLRRFSRLSQQTGIVRKAKKKQYFEKDLSALQKKKRAIMREHLRGLRTRLEKLGKYSDTTFREEKKKYKQELGR